MDIFARAIVAMLVSVICLFAQAPFAENTSKLLTQAQPAAVKSLETLRHLVTSENFRKMGFRTVEEVRSASLGRPLQVFKVRLDQLRKYDAATDPQKLLSGGDTFIYPVNSENQVRSSVTIAKVGEKWNPVAFGNPESVKIIIAVREKANVGNLSRESQFVVSVPALNLSFLGEYAGERLMLTPLFDDSRFNFKANVTLPATEVFSRITPAAKEHSGLPG